MLRYTPKTPKHVEEIFERVDGSRGGDVIVPTRIGTPVATGLSDAEFERETSKFYDAEPLDEDMAEQVIAELSAPASRAR